MIIDAGRSVLTMESDAARERYQKVYVRFSSERERFEVAGATVLKRRGREIELLAHTDLANVLTQVSAASPETVSTEALTLEEIFVATLGSDRKVA
jgi:hypothetical protein